MASEVPEGQLVKLQVPDQPTKRARRGEARMKGGMEDLSTAHRSSSTSKLSNHKLFIYTSCSVSTSLTVMLLCH